MIRASLLALMLTPVFVYATVPVSECAAPGRYIEQSLFSSFTKDLMISSSAIARGNTTVDVLSITPISDVFARQLAKTDSAVGNGLSESDYYGIYHNGHVLNLTARYTYTSIDGKKDIFITSALVNDDECSVRHNGYLTISRDF
ncbi:Shiga toxin A subunit [Lelliottia sp. CFBP8978]|uniref:Shiga toxin A subunit n=1 Tax=Lelliottia sp. CFBP8978 TaxID=3096522 RepID=UPI002A6A1509|nr:Shiga toxin A subunit [Lelliottia sp. CFBP8978]MDY1037829.1 Shiga toxin A subunit [Lelliottia sp. CFBP8978]